MKVIFVHHSCFVVEMEDVVLIFDYFEGNRVTGYTFTGVLPVFDKDKSIYFFASHKHQDHFDLHTLTISLRKCFVKRYKNESEFYEKTWYSGAGKEMYRICHSG